MKAMISQPMAGKTDEEITETRDRAYAKLREMGYEFVNTLFTDEWYSDDAMEKTRRGASPVVLPRKVNREYDPVPCGLFLQRLGERARVPH